MVDKKHVVLTEKNRGFFSGRGILIATRVGTHKLGDYRESYDKDGRLVFKGRPVIDEGEVVATIETPNIICNEGLQLVAGFTMDESATYDTGLTYCEIGTDDTTPAAGDTALGAFHHRNAITSRSRDNYNVTFSTFFTAAEATAAIEEAGIWGGGDAAAGEATGLLFAHWLASFDNSLGAYDLTIKYILSVSRG